MPPPPARLGCSRIWREGMPTLHGVYTVEGVAGFPAEETPYHRSGFLETNKKYSDQEPFGRQIPWRFTRTRGDGRTGWSARRPLPAVGTIIKGSALSSKKVRSSGKEMKATYTCLIRNQLFFF